MLDWLFGGSSKPKETVGTDDISRTIAANAEILAGMQNVANALKNLQGDKENPLDQDLEFLKQLREEGRVP